MKHKVSVRFPAKSEVVIKAFTDPEFHTGKLKQMGIADYEVLDQQSDGRKFSIRIRRKVPIGVPIPGPLKKLLGGGEMTVEHEDQWNTQGKTGRASVEVVGMPVDLSCHLSLDDEDDGCVYTYDWNIRGRVPLIGGLLERTLIADLDKKTQAETEASIALLKHYQ